MTSTSTIFRLNNKCYKSTPATEPALKAYSACSQKLSLTRASGLTGIALSTIGYLTSYLGPCAALVSCCVSGVCSNDPFMLQAEMEGIVAFMAEEVRRDAEKMPPLDVAGQYAIDLGDVAPRASAPADIEVDSKKND